MRDGSAGVRIGKTALDHGRHKNLVVAATGTGKTLIAAFDYRRLARRNDDAALAS